MLAIFLLILVSEIGFAFTLHKTYPAHSSVLVRLGQEYVYEPRAGDAARGAVPRSDQLIGQSETEILAASDCSEAAGYPPPRLRQTVPQGRRQVRRRHAR